jgi:endoglucanase
VRIATLSASLLAAAASLAAVPAALADPAPIGGNWVGKLQVDGKDLRIAVHLQRSDGELSGTIDSPDQNAFGVPLANVIETGDGLSFDIPQAGGSYSAHWDAATGSFIGDLRHEGQPTLALALKRGGYSAPRAGEWDEPLAAGFHYDPAPAAKPRVGPAARVGKCINISNTLEAPHEGAWAPAVAEDDLKIIAAAGFKTVRVPVAWANHAESAPPYTIDPAFLARVHHVIDLATGAGLQAILDFHGYTAFEQNADGERQRFVALWDQVARSFAGAPQTVWFELLNEPHDQLVNANLPGLYAPALKAIRASNPSRVVVVGPEWNNLDKLIAYDFPADPNVVPSFHYYDPFLFTHQGARWAEIVPPMGRGFGSAQDKAELDRTLAKVAKYMAQTGRVPFVGEYGAQDDPRVPLNLRIRYYGIVSDAFASLGVDSCAWGYRAGFRLRDGDHWVPGLVEAIAATREP